MSEKPAGNPGSTVEATAVYDWMAGESPVPVERMGTVRQGMDDTGWSAGPNGVYFMSTYTNKTFIRYMDNGAGTAVKLCSRPDCLHETSECNAYVKEPDCLTYYNGYLYVVSGYRSEEESVILRMDPDGLNRLEVFDLLAFARENGGDYVSTLMASRGYLIFDVCHWVQVDNGNPDKVTTQGKTIQTYAYKIDGSAGNPKPVNPRGLISYCCADVFLTYDPIPANGGKYGSYYYFNPATGERTYLTEHPGEPGYFDKEEGDYFIDGDTQEEEILVETGLEGSYILVCTPDCLILASRGVTSSHDDTLYFYNWDFQLVDTVVVSYPHEVGLEHLIYGETVDKILLSTSSSGMPKYYIDKAELGTENAGVHTINFEN